MAATRDIMATYRAPGKVMHRILDRETREDRALIYLMLGCLMVFVAQTPLLARKAFETGDELNALLGGALMAWLFVMPLVLYLLAGLSGVIARLIGSKITSYGARMALFWALLATSPLMLLRGLTGGFIGPGLELELVGALWFGAFVWFWISGFRAAARDAA